MKRRAFAALCIALPVVGPASAHHAWTEIDTSKSITLTGVVETLRWENPHASLTLRVKENGADVLWTIELSGLARMQSHGFSAEQFAKGTTLTVVASPAKVEPRTARGNRFRIDGKDHVLY